jgi:peptide deformylase
VSVIPENVDSLEIVCYPHPALRQPAAPVDPADPNLPRLAARMIELMHKADGVGLAANQVGLPIRVFVANPTRNEPGKDIVLINPDFVETEGWQETSEGCLSVPGVTLKLRRRERIKVRFVNLAGQAMEIDASGFLATIFQHETDHLDGKLIIDRASMIGRFAIRDAVRRLEEKFQVPQNK